MMRYDGPCFDEEIEGVLAEASEEQLVHCSGVDGAIGHLRLYRISLDYLVVGSLEEFASYDVDSEGVTNPGELRYEVMTVEELLADLDEGLTNFEPVDQIDDADLVLPVADLYVSNLVEGMTEFLIEAPLLNF